MYKSFFIGLFFTFFTFQTCFSQNTSNIHPLDFEDTTFTSLQFLDSIVAKKEIFFSGESHNISTNGERHLYLFKYLYYKANVRYYIMEANFSYTYYFNKYIQSGDENELKKTTMLADTTHADIEFRSLLKEMYLFNKSLAINKKIQILGIDFQGFYGDTYRNLLKDISNNGKDTPLKIQKDIEQLCKIERHHYKGFGLDISGKDKKGIMIILNAVRENYDENKKMYADFFGKDLVNYLLIIKNYTSERRVDKNMAKNFFEHIYPNYTQGGFFFQYGSLHTRYKSGWMADKIRQDERLTNKCLNFVGHYYNCSSEFIYKTYYAENMGVLNFNGFKKHIPFFVENTKTDFSIIDTNLGKGFKKLHKLVDYIIFTKNQDAEK